MEDINILKEENEKLKKMVEFKSDLISISSHQLRTSLSALRWILKMFIDKDLGSLNNEQFNMLQKAFNSSNKMISLVNDLLTLSHTEDTMLKLQTKEVDLINTLEQTIFDFSGESNKKNVELIFIKPESIIPKAKCDEELIGVVFQNLIENALKYSKPHDNVFISLIQKDKEIEISFRDNGIGIKEEDKNHIFDKFFRATNALDKDEVGSGLGLFTSKNIIEKHGGKIWFEESNGGGVTFFVSLPLN